MSGKKIFIVMAIHEDYDSTSKQFIGAASTIDGAKELGIEALPSEHVRYYGSRCRTEHWQSEFNELRHYFGGPGSVNYMTIFETELR